MLCLDQCLQKFINKTLQGGKRLLFNSDPWPPAEQKLEMPCDISVAKNSHEQFMITNFNILAFVTSLSNFNIFLFEQ